MKPVIRGSVIGLLLWISVPLSGYGQDSVAYWLEMADSLRQTKNYSEELGYRQKIVEARPKERLRDYYYLMIALHRCGKAEAAEDIVEEMKITWPDHFANRPGRYNRSFHWRFDQEKMSDPEYLSEQIYLLELTPTEQLKSHHLSQLRTWYMLLVFTLFDQQPDGTGNCDAVEPWLSKALVYAPEDEFLVSLKSLCEEK